MWNPAREQRVGPGGHLTLTRLRSPHRRARCYRSSGVSHLTLVSVRRASATASRRTKRSDVPKKLPWRSSQLLRFLHVSWRGEPAKSTSRRSSGAKRRVAQKACIRSRTTDDDEGTTETDDKHRDNDTATNRVAAGRVLCRTNRRCQYGARRLSCPSARSPIRPPSPRPTIALSLFLLPPPARRALSLSVQPALPLGGERDALSLSLPRTITTCHSLVSFRYPPLRQPSLRPSPSLAV